jgi:hypothetical protein
MSYSPAVARARGALAIHSRYHRDDVEGLAELRRQLVTEKLAAHLERELGTAALTDEQLDRLIGLLRSTGHRTAVR